ncbi:hypothetical protein ZIOFF_011510 [Zingiber officinale]|uniref:Mitochondrial inner membrane protease ATP23 n=1 Tax=Zingiber officinale TaxID=94328 RepID=A0A8J5HR50_ZINOF|nr:hypothetical protein ZIOFF_011510 [Zingiber officinale]
MCHLNLIFVIFLLQITICCNHMSFQNEIDQVIIHELIHAYDDCRAKNLDWTNCAHHACSEVQYYWIRANHLSGDCHYKRELLRGFLKIRGHEQVGGKLGKRVFVGGKRGRRHWLVPNVRLSLLCVNAACSSALHKGSSGDIGSGGALGESSGDDVQVYVVLGPVGLQATATHKALCKEGKRGKRGNSCNDNCSPVAMVVLTLSDHGYLPKDKSEREIERAGRRGEADDDYVWRGAMVYSILDFHKFLIPWDIQRLAIVIDICFLVLLKECVRRRSLKSVQSNPHCSDVTAKDAIEAIWGICYNDTTPFDRAP